MSNTATTPELEQRLEEIEEQHSQFEELTNVKDYLEMSMSGEMILVLMARIPFLVSTLREALATVEKLGELIDRKEPNVDIIPELACSGHGKPKEKVDA